MPEFLETDDEAIPESLAELRSNLEYARDLVRGGRFLERLQVRAFDVADLYRAAWVQAVSALDHWLHRELYDRALAFALDTSGSRPAKFLKIKIPMSLFEEVRQNAAAMREAFQAHLRREYGHLSFQAPEKIKEALAVISDASLWPRVAEVLSDETGQQTTPEEVQQRLRDITRRRNRIAHSADRDPNHKTARQQVSDHEATDTIDWIDRVAGAIHTVIGPAPEMPADEPAPADASPRKRWARQDVDEALERIGDTHAGDALRRLLAHADQHDAMVRGGTSPEPSAGLYYWFQGQRRSLWSVWVTSIRPCIALNLGSIRPRDADLVDRMVSELRTDRSLDAALLHDDEVLVKKYPTFQLSTLGESPDAVDTIIRTLDLAIRTHGSH